MVLMEDGLLASGSGDKTVKIWNLDTGGCVATLRGHTNGVRCLAALEGGRIASGSHDCSIKIWEVADPKAWLAIPNFCLPDLVYYIFFVILF